MLRERVITALVLLAILALAAAWSPVAVLACAAFLLGTALSEWLVLAGMGAMAARVLATLLLAAALGAEVAGWRLSPVAVHLLMALALVAWAAAAVRVVRAQRGAGPIARGQVIANGFFLVACGWFGVDELLRSGYAWTVSVLAIVWVADIGAYAAGRTFGRRKLASRVSPGKTWEGVAGAVACVGMVVVLAHALLAQALPLFSSRLIDRSPVLAVFILVTLVAASIVGDLFESLVKRQAGAKDSGRLLPGHGGAWDRIDALLPAVPIAVLAQQWLGLAPA